MDDAIQFLSRHEESAQFLANNLKTHGSRLTDHQNSGNFKVIVSDSGVIGIYCLTKRGNLLIQCEEAADPHVILGDCVNDRHAVKGFVGDWNSVYPVFETYKELNPKFKPSFYSKEILYRYRLDKNDQTINYDSRVRLLVETDYEKWLPLINSYFHELGIPTELSEEQKRNNFSISAKNKQWWGLFEGNELLSISGLNSNGERIGQVGGVFTVKIHRKKGYSKATLLHMLNDCKHIHRHCKSILYTGTSDISAQKLYESIGYERIGYFALILS